MTDSIEIVVIFLGYLITRDLPATTTTGLSRVVSLVVLQGHDKFVKFDCFRDVVYLFFFSVTQPLEKGVSVGHSLQVWEPSF